MATSKEMDDFIKTVMVEKDLDMRMAHAWVLGYVTDYVPSEKIERAILSMKEGN